MKILYICPTKALYGDNKAILKIMPYLIQEGIEPFFFTPHKGEFTDYLDSLGYKYLSDYDIFSSTMWPKWNSFRDLLGWLKRLLLGKNYREFKRLTKEVKKIKPDLIHSNNSCTDIGYKLSNKLHIQHIWHVREYGKLDHNRNQFPSKRFLQQKFSNRLSKSIFITKDIQSYYNCPDGSTVIYDGPIDTNNNNKYLNKTKKPFFLYVGRIIETKGVHHIIEAFSIFHKINPNYSLKIIGEGNEKYIHRLKERIEILNLKKSVDFLGYKENVYLYMKEAMAIIVASQYEAFGFITSEALYNGCLVIGHNTAGTKEQMNNVSDLNNKNEFITIPYNKSSEIVKALHISTKVTYSEEFLKKIQNRIIYLYNSKKSADSLLKFYQKCLKV